MVEEVTRSAGLSKTILQGTVQGKRRQGRQRKKQADNIAEWTGKSFSTTKTLVQLPEVEPDGEEFVTSVPPRPERVKGN